MPDILVDIYSGLVTYWYIVPFIVFYVFYRKYESRRISEENERADNAHTISRAKQRERGGLYVAYISNLYKQNGYTIVADGIYNSVHEQGIDIIAIKDKELLFIKCKDWDINSRYKINRKDIQYVRMNVRDYLDKNPLFHDYKWKILYITSQNIFDKSANSKIIEHSDEIDHKIIPAER